MIHLKKGKLQGKLDETSQKLHNNKRDYENGENDNKNNEIEDFSSSVLKFMLKESVPPTPNNFKIYFEKLLEKKPISFRKKIIEYLKNDDDDEINENRIKMEKEVQEGFVHIKGMLKVVSTVYKNLNVLKQIVKRHSFELKVNSSQLFIENTLSTLDKDLEKLTALTLKQMEALKSYYDKTINILKNVDDKAIYDLRYG